MTPLLLAPLLAPAHADDPAPVEVSEDSPAALPDAWQLRPNSLRATFSVFYSGLVGARYDRSLGERWTVGGTVAAMPGSLHAHARFRPYTFNGVFAPAVELNVGGGGFLNLLDVLDDPWVLDGAAVAAMEYRSRGGFNFDFAVSGGPVYLPRTGTLLPVVLGLRLGVGGAW